MCGPKATHGSAPTIPVGVGGYLDKQYWDEGCKKSFVATFGLRPRTYIEWESRVERLADTAPSNTWVDLIALTCEYGQKSMWACGWMDAWVGVVGASAVIQFPFSSSQAIDL